MQLTPRNVVDRAAGSGASPLDVLPGSGRPVAGSRIAFIDNARAIGIVLVVLGHAPALPGAWSDFIFAFHMPLFFCLSGLMVGSTRLDMSTRRRVLMLARTLLLPYLFFFLLSFAYWLIAKRHGLRAAEFEALPWWQPLVGLAEGTADGLYFNVVLWFFPCLFVTSVVHHVVRKFVSGSTTLAITLSVAYAFVMLRDPSASRWWWSADCAVIALAFFTVGASFNTTLKHGPSINRARSGGLAVAMFLATLLLSLVTGHVDLNHLMFGAWPALYLPMGLIGTVGVVALSAALPASSPGRWLSQNTVVIFPLHFLFFSVITGIGLLVFKLPAEFKNGPPIVALIYLALALLLSWPATYVLRKVCPWGLGLHRIVGSTPVAATFNSRAI